MLSETAEATRNLAQIMFMPYTDNSAMTNTVILDNDIAYVRVCLSIHANTLYLWMVNIDCKWLKDVTIYAVCSSFSITV